MTNTLATITSTTTRQPVVVHTSEKVTGTGLLEAAYGGTVRFSKVRSTGTERHWPVLAPGSAQRKQAEDIMARRANKETVDAIAASLHTSVPTVRRTITALAFTLELEAMKAADRAAIAKAANANLEAAPKAEPKPEPKPEVKAEPKPKAPKPSAPKGKATTKATPKAKVEKQEETPAERKARVAAEAEALLSK